MKSCVHLRSEFLRMTVLSRGGIIASLEYLRAGQAPLQLVLAPPADLVSNPWYVNAFVGPFANRVSSPHFEVEGERYEIPAHPETGTLHGGRLGFSYRDFELHQINEGEALLRLEIPHRCDGFPGNRRLELLYRLEGATLHIGSRLTSDRLTPANLTHHAYFNLNGRDSGSVDGHRLQLHASRLLETRDGLPTGRLLGVDGTDPCDFRNSRPLGSVEHDQCYLLEQPLAARICGDRSGLSLELSTDAPCLQLFNAGGLGRSAFCLEAQGWLDSLHRPEFPSCLSRDQRQQCRFSFSIP
ncbi:MAG: hypothetical protein RL095_583 [Verrucomicrobiota bacterium]|jgi:aldose 1-epimerase